MSDYDLIILGGGINGCGAARDASLRGLRVLLLEKQDLGSGTSGGSSKLIHGGLRYLPQGHLGLVREGLRERALLLRNAPHLVEPLKFGFPLYRGQGGPHPWLLRLGLTLYSGISGFYATPKEGRGHGWLGSKAALSAMPLLNPEGLRGAGWYWDSSTDDARLCLENALDAETHGAEILTWTEALSLEETPGHVTVRYRNRLEGGEDEASAPCVFAALGPFLGRGIEGLKPPTAMQLAPSRGSHLVLEGRLTEEALVLPARDGRISFLIPWGGWTLLGTTDAPESGDPGRVSMSFEEAEYLLALARPFVKPGLDLKSLAVSSFCAVRPLVGGTGKNLHEVSREHSFIRVGRALFLAGGKLTSYRSIAEEVCDEVLRVLERPLAPTSTKTRPLPRGASGPARTVLAGIPPGHLAMGHDEALGLARVYGSDLPRLLRVLDEDPDLARPLWSGPRPRVGCRVLKGEAIYAAKYDRVTRLQDFMVRRTGLALTPGGGELEARTAAGLLGGALGWTRQRQASELEDYLGLRETRMGLPWKNATARSQS